MSSTHANPLGTKTDAPPGLVWDIMRCWVAEHPSRKPPEPESYAGKLLAKEPTIKADFSRNHGAISASKQSRARAAIPLLLFTCFALGIQQDHIACNGTG